MVASVPDDTARTISIDGSARVRRSANSTSRSVGAPKEVPSRAVRSMASSTSGWAWPTMSGPHEPT